MGKTRNPTRIALACWLARTQLGAVGLETHDDRPSIPSRGTAWRFGLTVRSGHHSALRNAVQWKKPGGHIAACGPARLNRARPDRRISLLSSVRVPRSKLRNRIAQLLSLRWASAIVSFRIASDR
jgi:hypothetical protein